MMPPYSRERKHRIAIFEKYFWLKLSHLMIHSILKIELIGSLISLKKIEVQQLIGIVETPEQKFEAASDKFRTKTRKL